MGLAAQLGRVEAIKTLADNGCNPNCENRDGATPLMMALEAGQQSSVAALLQVGAPAEHLNLKGETALVFCSKV